MTDHWKKHYQRWLAETRLDQELREQLESLREDAKTLEDCFCQNLEFGTGGMRGEMGPGPNRFNLYTVRKATEGLARYASGFGIQAKERGVAIAYDSRRKSREFALEAARVLGKHGIRTFVFDRLTPTPLLSYAVRRLGAFSGIVLTASHNPPEYNGYKVYGPDGGQITLAAAEAIMAKRDEVEDELKIAAADLQELAKSGLLTAIGSELLHEYLEELKSVRLQPELQTGGAQLVKIVFTPLHGTTLEPIAAGLGAFGYEQVKIVAEQAQPDPDFSHTPSPNPEDHQAYELAIQYGREQNADLILATDPDGDRLGAAVPNKEGGYTVLSGNQIGALLLEYVLSQKQRKGILPKNGVVLKTIVTSEMGRAIAAHYGLATVDTLTGFKFIAEKIGEYEKTGEYRFQFGYEESCGFLAHDFVRDKDAVQTALLLADACAFYKSQKKSLYGVLLDLYARHGYYREALHAVAFKGRDGAKKMADFLSQIRRQPLTGLAGKKLTAVEDYLTGKRLDAQTGEITPLALPASNVIKFHLEDDSWCCIRPSGTEPKLKLYFGVKGSSLEESRKKLALLKQSLIRLLPTD